MIQVLSGVQVTPMGGSNRFASENWPNSYAFGGWIYNVDASLGFSEKPTEVRLSVVLETSTFAQTGAVFNIQPSDLHCDAGAGGLDNEIWYNLNVEGFQLNNFVLYDYDFSIENSQKILNVTFKDYSVILDKIYIGLFKKQGYKYPHLLNCQIELPIRCQDCEYTGGAVTGTGIAFRDIGFGCYAGNNGGYTDLFASSFYMQKSVFQEWQDAILNNQSVVNQFDLNGGYLILGTESATEDRCNSAPNITYSFPELLAALRKNGLNLSGAFPQGTGDSDYVYRNNHNGSLREVLQNWCSDLGYTFYTSGRAFVALDLKNPIDITAISQLADPTSTVGSSLQINGGANTAITNFNVKTTLDNTYRQAVVVDNSYPITQKDISKSVKKYVGVTPLHPISINQIDSGIITDTNLYGTQFERRRFETPWFDSGNYIVSYFANFARLDGRSYNDVDAAIALSYYNDTLRDLFVAQRALYNAWGDIPEIVWTPEEATATSVNYWPLNNAYARANFAALGMFPIMEITDSELKTNIVLDNFKNAEKDGIANINIDQKYFRVFLGYYYEDLKNDIVSWEKAAGDAMYKYGVVTDGILTDEPFIPPNFLNDISPTVGFYGSSGLNYTRINNSFIPDTNRYQDVKFTPFADVLLYSGYVSTPNSTGIYYNNNSQYNAYVPPGFSDYSGRIPTGLWVSTMENPWGINVHDFDRALSLTLDDPCAAQYPLDQAVQQILTDSDKRVQDWRLDYFKPIVNPDLSTVYEIIQSDQFNFNNTVDDVLATYTNFNFIRKAECKKLHIIIIPDTRHHPNIDIRFFPMGVNKINGAALITYKQKLYEADLRKNTTETPSICSISLLDEMCRNMLTGGNAYEYAFNPPLTTQQSGCVLLEDKNNYFLEGFPTEVLFSPNSRSLEVCITKNPNRNIYPTLDENGDYYYADLNLGNLLLDSFTINGSIVYPIQSFPNSIANFSGIYQSDITTEFRIPAFAQVFGEPVNTTRNNTAGFKLVTNTVDNTLNPILDPLTNEVKPYITVLDGVGTSIIKTPEQYYGYIKNLNNYNLTAPMKQVTMTLAGPPSQFGPFQQFINPASGLQQFNLSVSDNGVKTDLTFSDRPKVLPKQEVFLNKIGARIKGTYN